VCCCLCRFCCLHTVERSLEPYDKKLGTDTWYYAKRCFLGLAETLAKHMVMLKDATFYEILNFLDAADSHGKAILTVISQVRGRGAGGDGGGGGGGGGGPREMAVRRLPSEARSPTLILVCG
jgi:hypothetical protein